MRYLNFIDGLNRILKLILAGCFVIMVALVFFQVLTRFVFTKFGLDISATWTQELSRYLMIWLVFLGSAVGMRSDRMLHLDAFSSILPKTFGISVKILSLVLTVIFFLYLIL